MTIWYSPSSRGFYDSNLHTQRPNDCVEVPQNDYDAIFAAQSRGEGAIVPGENGRPTIFNPPMTATQLAVYANTFAKRLLAVPRNYTASGVTISADSTQGTRIDLTNLMTWGAANEAETHPWVADDGTVTEVTGAQFVAIGHLVGTYALSVYATLAEALTGINATPATITTAAQIDALNWPV